MINNEKGFIFPYALFIIALTFIILTANIRSYQTEIKVEQFQSEQIKVETLMQMAKTQFMDETSDILLSDDGIITYEFPQGNVEADYHVLDKETYEVDFIIVTDEGIKHLLRQKINTNGS